MSEGSQLVPAPATNIAAGHLAGLAQIGSRMLTAFRTGIQLRANAEPGQAVVAFQAAFAALSEFRDALTIYDTAMAPPSDDPIMDVVAEATAFSTDGDKIIAAFFNWSQAELAMSTAEFGNAAGYYNEASGLFAECGAAYNVPAHLVKAQGLQADAQKYMRDGNKGLGQERLNAAISLMYSEVMPHLDQLEPSDAGAILLLLAAMKVGQSIKSMQDEVVREDYGAALSFSEQIHEDVARMRNQANAISLPDDVLRKLSQFLTTMTLSLSGLEAVALAGKAGEEQRWETFEQQANLAKVRFVEAQQACLQNRETVVYSGQMAQLIEILVEPTRRHGRKLRTLYAQLDEWKESFRSLAGKAGTQIEFANNAQANAEARTQVAQTVQVSVEVANFFQDRTVEALLGLKATLNLAPADLPERDELLQKLRELVQVPKDDPSWLPKVKAFTSDALRIVGNIAKIVTPVAAAWNVLAPLFGMPPLPIPA